TNYNKNNAKDLAITKVENSKENSATPSTESTTEIEPASDESTAPDKTPALDFKLKDLNGKEVSLSDFKGKKVFLNFWASWCPPCKAEMPDIEEVYNETKDSDLVIIAINVGESRDTAKSFIEENNFNFKVLLDSDENISNQYKLLGYPTSYFIDTEGNIVSMKSGYMTLEEMKAHINEL
ncbi:MAG: TlpA family protein disulfide reductase, partial [Clostridiaceae bacterium]|nr:TlpA family protein disulfide reductase [Clostridiaceae bacterium]